MNYFNQCSALLITIFLVMLAGCQTQKIVLQPTGNQSHLSVKQEALQQESFQPESSSGLATNKLVKGKVHMAATANPYASEAALKILRAGGSAIDAAIAAQWVLTLVEPQSSGLGGGAFMLSYQANAKQLIAYDGRETAPSLIDERLLLDKNGRALKFHEAAVGGRAVGVPGVVAMMALAHKEHGKLPWSDLFTPAIELAQMGFLVSARLNTLVTKDAFLALDPTARAYFYDAKLIPWPVGHRLKNPTLALTLKAIARDGPSAFYEGPIAQSIVTAVTKHPTNPGVLSLADLANYQPIKRAALCAIAFGHQVCGVPPPSSGGISVLQILTLLELSNAPQIAKANAELQADGIHYFTEAARLAFADRNQYIADPLFNTETGLADDVKSLLSRQYLSQRAALINPDKSMGTAQAGQPLSLRTAVGNDLNYDKPATSHIAIVDQAGNAVSLTTSIEDVFGARLMTGGFLLNNQLTDFSFMPTDSKGVAIANRAQAGKRPRSSMAPTLVFDGPIESGNLVLVTGSPGGAQIINYVAKTIVAHLRDRLDIQSAISLPNFGSRNGPTELERDRFSAQLVEQLKSRNHDVRLIDMTSGLQGIAIRYESSKDEAAKGNATKRELQKRELQKRELLGGADPRREGLVVAD